MAGIGFVRQWTIQRKLGYPDVGKLMFWAGLAFLFEAFMVGLTVPAAPYGPASYYKDDRVLLRCFHRGADYQPTTVWPIRLAGEENGFSARLYDLPFAKIQVTSACTACGACARSCPNTALELIEDTEQQRYWLLFTPTACIGCEICQHVCSEQAVKVDHSPQFMDIFGTHEKALLSRGELARCTRCNQLFAVSGKNQLCPVCEYRRSNPFGSDSPRK